MRTKPLVLQALESLPDDVPMAGVFERFQFIAKLQQRMSVMEGTRRFTLDEMRHEITQWRQ